MLSTKYIYALSFMFLAHLGCKSSHCNQMKKQEQGVDKKIGQSSHDVPDMVGLSELLVGDTLSNSSLETSVKNLLGIGCFELGFPVEEKFSETIEDRDIDFVLNELNKSIKISNIDKEYLKFLRKYGSMRGAGFEICGATKFIKNKGEYISLVQRGFENVCAKKWKKINVKSCWLIAKIDQGDKYYIDSSRDREGYIYSISPEGKSKIFARSFLEFLNKAFELYVNKKEEDNYEKNVCEESIYEKIGKFLETDEFKQGSPINNDEINLVLQKLGKVRNILYSLNDYNEFLNQYGSIHNSILEICGPTENVQDKVQHIVSTQLEFDKFLKEKLPEEDVKKIWLIAKMNKGERYYMYLQGSDAGKVYSINSNNSPVLFANSFLDFLDKSFEVYDINKKIDILLKMSTPQKGYPVDNDTINSVLQKLGKDIKSLDEIPELKDYKEFLNQYGSIENVGGSIDQTEHMLLEQREFEDFLKKVQPTKVLKNVWLITQTDQGNRYFIILKDDSKFKGFVFYINSEGKHMQYASNFLEFLDKFSKE